MNSVSPSPMRHVALCVALFLMVCAAHWSAGAPIPEWQPLAPGISYRMAALQRSSDRVSVPATVVRVVLDSAQVRIIDVYGTLRSRRRSFGYSLKEISQLESARVLMNGGFSNSFTLPLPAGLLVRDGQTVSQLTTEALLDGVLCIEGRRTTIMKRGQYPQEGDQTPQALVLRRPRCPNALQAGPLLVVGGLVAVGDPVPGMTRDARRSSIGIDDAGHLYLVVAGSLGLGDMARFLFSELKCTTALNLGGSTDSGLLLRRGNQWLTYGSVDGPIASAIAVGRR